MSMTARRIKITGPRRERLDTAALARLLADLAGRVETEPPDQHPTRIRPDQQGTKAQE
ncbi:hypothetical protein AB0A73_10315 [Glycomyces sp. NPDC047369]